MKWHKVITTYFGLRSITYELRADDGTVMGGAHQNGSKWWPWTWTHGGKQGTVETLSTAKAIIEERVGMTQNREVDPS